MKRRDYLVLSLVLIAAFFVIPASKGVVAATTVSVEGFLADVWDSVNNALQVSIVSTSANLATDGTLAVGGNSTLTGSLTVVDDTSFAGWNNYDIVATTSQSYSLASTGKASAFIQTVGAAGTFHLMTELLTDPGDGAVVTVKTGDSNDITIDTEGAETIDGAATYSLDGTLEAVTLTTDGTNWYVLGGYLE